MALTLGQGGQVINDLGYRLRVRDGMVRYSATVMAEALNAGGQSAATTGPKRKQLANRVLLSPDAYVDAFLALVASDPGASLTWVPPVAIASSSNLNPSVITTAAAHGIVAGDVVEVYGHLVNTNLNPLLSGTATFGVWTTPTASGTTLTIPTPANGAGTATGYVMKMFTDVEVNFTIQNNFNTMANTGSWDV